jgi:hypothetical protein
LPTRFVHVLSVDLPIFSTTFLLKPVGNPIRILEEACGRRSVLAQVATGSKLSAWLRRAGGRGASWRNFLIFESSITSGIAMRNPWILCGAVGLFVAGCQQPAPQRVLQRLPEPFYVQERTPPTAAPVPHSATPTLQPEQAWLPPQGISKRWNSIVIHHTASPIGSLREIDKWHRDKGWDCCGYHFVIGNGTGSGDGEIEVGPRWRAQITGAHTRLCGAPSTAEGNYYNEHGIGIVLVGNFDQRRPTDRQMASLARLVEFLSTSCAVPRERIYLHGDLKSTDCPGRNFSRVDLGRRLASFSGDIGREHAARPGSESYTQLAAGLNR